MPKYRVEVVTDEWKVGDTMDAGHGIIAGRDGCETTKMEVIAPDIASAKARAEDLSGMKVKGEPVLVN